MLKNEFSKKLRNLVGARNFYRIRGALLPVYGCFPRLHWSQTGEDVVLARLLTGARGTYVDVGAGHPIFGSNTYFLYRRGWSGVVVDPNPKYRRAFKKLRPRDRYETVALGSSNSTTTLYVFDREYFSTTQRSVADRLRGDGLNVNELLTVEQRRLCDLDLPERLEEPSLLSIDCEGSDLDVLQGADFSRFRPQIVCVEESKNTLTLPSPIRIFLEEKGYRLSAHTGVSSVYSQLVS